MGCRDPAWAFAGSIEDCPVESLVRGLPLIGALWAILAGQTNFRSEMELTTWSGEVRAKQSVRIRAQQERHHRHHGGKPVHSAPSSAILTPNAVRGCFNDLENCVPFVGLQENSSAIDPQRQQLCARGDDRGFDARARIRINHQRNATAASRAANFSGQRALPARGRNHFVDQRSRNRAKIAAAEIPFFAHQAANFVPLVSLERARERACAIIEIFSRFCETRRSPSMCRLNTSQLLMPCCRGFPV